MKILIVILAATVLTGCTHLPPSEDDISITISEGVTAMDVLLMFKKAGTVPLDPGGLSREELEKISVPPCSVTNANWKVALPMFMSKAGLHVEVIPHGEYILWKVTKQ